MKIGSKDRYALVQLFVEELSRRFELTLQVREGNSKRSLENVNAWNAGLLRNAASEGLHDIAVWLTRYDLGGPSGYAPVAGVCDPDRSCSLKCFPFLS